MLRLSFACRAEFTAGARQCRHHEEYLLDTVTVHHHHQQQQQQQQRQRRRRHDNTTTQQHDNHCATLQPLHTAHCTLQCRSSALPRWRRTRTLMVTYSSACSTTHDGGLEFWIHFLLDPCVALRCAALLSALLCYAALPLRCGVMLCGVTECGGWVPCCVSRAVLRDVSRDVK